MRPRDDRRPCRRGRAVAGDEGADTVERVGGDAAAVAEPGGELAVIDGAPPESRLGKSAVAAIVGNLLQQFLGVHGADRRGRSRRSLFLRGVVAPPSWPSEPRATAAVNHKSSHWVSGMDNGNLPTYNVGDKSNSSGFSINR